MSVDSVVSFCSRTAGFAIFTSHSISHFPGGKPPSPFLQCFLDLSSVSQNKPNSTSNAIKQTHRPELVVSTVFFSVFSESQHEIDETARGGTRRWFVSLQPCLHRAIYNNFDIKHGWSLSYFTMILYCRLVNRIGINILQLMQYINAEFYAQASDIFC